MNSVSCLAWVKRGASKRNPDRVVLNDEDLKKVIDVQSDKLKKLEVGEESDSDSDSEELPHKSAAASKNKVCLRNTRVLCTPQVRSTSYEILCDSGFAFQLVKSFRLH